MHINLLFLISLIPSVVCTVCILVHVHVFVWLHLCWCKHIYCSIFNSNKIWYLVACIRTSLARCLLKWYFSSMSFDFLAKFYKRLTFFSTTFQIIMKSFFFKIHQNDSSSFISSFSILSFHDLWHSSELFPNYCWMVNFGSCWHNPKFWIYLLSTNSLSLF